jgi:hypothetical protein
MDAYTWSFLREIKLVGKLLKVLPAASYRLKKIDIDSYIV